MYGPSSTPTTITQVPAKRLLYVGMEQNGALYQARILRVTTTECRYLPQSPPTIFGLLVSETTASLPCIGTARSGALCSAQPCLDRMPILLVSKPCPPPTFGQSAATSLVVAPITLRSPFIGTARSGAWCPAPI